MNVDAIAEILAQAGRNIILPAFHGVEPGTIKADGSVVTAVDVDCQRFVQQQLARLYPDIPFLGEEMAAAEQRHILEHSQGRFWCLDPLDGTSNFVTAMPLFASALALIDAGEPVAAWIHDPVRDETFTAGKGKEATLNSKPIAASGIADLKASIGFIDFKRLPADMAAHLATHRFYRSQRNIGSCALEWAWLAAGRAQFIVHGAQKLWDYAPGLCIAMAAGCVASSFDRKHPFPISRISHSIAAAANANLHRRLTEHLENV